jgi:hypothetical protein
MLRLVAALAVLCGASAFHMQASRMATRARQISLHMQSTDEDSTFDPKDFDDALKSVGPVYNKLGMDEDVFNEFKKKQDEKAEEIYRVYPYAEIELPVLPDCNNYYSGEMGDYFWHQNADQVYVYIPIDEEIKRKEIKITFAAKKVDVRIRGEDVVSFDTLERIIPDGSFWVFEHDKDGRRFLHLDLEKRFRMINWKNLFDAAPVEDDATTQQNRAKIMEKLFAANKGMSKLSGIEPESMQELMKNGELAKMVAQEIYADPSVSVSNLLGYESEPTLIEDEFEELNLKEMEILDAEVVEDAEEEDVVDAEMGDVVDEAVDIQQ